MDFVPNFARMLKEARERAQLTQKELADQVGISHTYISKIERGGAPPTREKVVAIADALGITDEVEQAYFLLAAGCGDLKDVELLLAGKGQESGLPAALLSPEVRSLFHQSKQTIEHIDAGINRLGTQMSELAASLNAEIRRQMAELDTRLSEEIKLQMRNLAAELRHVPTPEVIDIGAKNPEIRESGINNFSSPREEDDLEESGKLDEKLSNPPRVQRLMNFLITLSESGESYVEEHFSPTYQSQDSSDVHMSPNLPKQKEDYDYIPEILNIATRLFETAVHQPEIHGEIFISSQVEQNFLELATRNSALYEKWWSTLGKVLMHGWNVSHLVRLGAGEERTLDLLQNMFKLVGAQGEYLPRYLSRNEAFTPDYDLIIVPQIGALTIQSLIHNQHAATANFYPDGHPKLAELIAESQELRPLGSPLFTAYIPNSVEFTQAITDKELCPGPRMLFKAGLGTITVPDTVEEERTRLLTLEGGEPAEVVQHMIELRKKRKKSFRKQMNEFAFRDLHAKSAIERYVLTGEFPRDDWILRAGGEPATPEQQMAHLQNILQLLENDNYEIRLIEMSHNWALSALNDFYYEIKHDNRSGKGTLFLEIMRRNSKGELSVKKEMMIQEPTTVEAFQWYFTKIWNGDGVVKEKKQIIDFFNEQITILKGKMSPDS